MSYAVLGGTGNTGKIAAERLLAAGKPVRLLARDATKLASLAARGAEVVVGDVTDAASLARAFDGVAGAYVLVPPNMAAESFRAYQERVIRALSEAVKLAGVPHVVLLSSVGAQHPTGTGPIAALHVAEEALATTGAALTSIRAAYFMENVAGSLSMLGAGVLPSFLPLDVPLDMIATRDIGALAATSLLEGRSTSGVVELGGPPITMRQVAEVLAGLVGRPVEAKDFGLDAAVPTLTGLGMSADMAGLYGEMLRGIVSGRVAFEGGHRRVQGTTSLAEVLRPLLPKV
jgi:uncharacterized protein YbjT (DUF2867 family)